MTLAALSKQVVGGVSRECECECECERVEMDMEKKNDPVLELADGWKKVSYFGHELIVPTWVRWLVSDMNGLVGGFEAEPRVGKIYWLGGDSEATNILMYLNLNGLDWRETLREV